MKSRMEISIWESVLVSSMAPLTVSTYCVCVSASSDGGWL